MPTDAQRRLLFDAARRAFGPNEAGILMELLPPAGWGDLARQGDLAVTRADFNAQMAELRGEMAELRGEIAELRGEVRAMLPKLVAANIASMVGVAGLVAAVFGVAA